MPARLLGEKIDSNLRDALDLERAQLAAALREIDRLRDQLARATAQLAGLPKPAKKPKTGRAKSHGWLWAECRFRKCARRTRYKAAGGPIANQPCKGCGRPLGRGANKRALRHLRKYSPESSVGRAAENLLRVWEGKAHASTSSGERAQSEIACSD